MHNLNPYALFFKMVLSNWKIFYDLEVHLIRISLGSHRIDIHSITIFHSYPLSTPIWNLIFKPPSPKRINPTKARRGTSSQQTRRCQSIPVIPNYTMYPYFTRPYTSARKEGRIIFRLSFPCPSRCRTIKKFLKNQGKSRVQSG